MFRSRADELRDSVREYLADCRRHAGILSAKYHPTEDGAVTMVHHRGRAEAEMIRRAFRYLTAGRR